MSRVIVVGIGPGDAGGMTGHCLDALRQANILCGYDAYIQLVGPLFPDKPAIATGMTREVERCRMALEAAATGQTVAVVCSGDAGVYGMAGLVLQLAEEYPGVEVDIVPGVSAAMAGAAVLGAPLMHDFAVVSLSDLLTPWDVIVKRLDGAAAAGFVLCLYNPSSKKRHDYLAKACDIVLKHRPPETICGWVRNIGRDGQKHGILTLGQLRNWQADMFATVYIGSEETRVVDGRMVTPRGYAGVAR